LIENKKLVAGWYLPLKEKHFESYLLRSINQNGVGEYQKEQRSKSFSYLSHNNVAIDIGACVGFWTKDLCENFKNVIFVFFIFSLNYGFYKLHFGFIRYFR